MSAILTIEGVNDMFDDYNGILPPDVSGFGLQIPIISNLLPSMEEFQTSAVAGGGVALGLMGGLGFERLVLKNLPSIPKAAMPIAIGTVGAMVGKFVADYNAPLGIGVASGAFALALVRALQNWFKVDVSFAGLADIGEISDLADLLGSEDADLLPDLNGYDNVMIEDNAPGAMAQVQVSSRSLAGWFN